MNIKKKDYFKERHKRCYSQRNLVYLTTQTISQNDFHPIIPKKIPKCPDRSDNAALA